MPRTDNELKAQLKAKAEAAIEQLVAEKKQPGEIKLSEIEQAVYQVGEIIKTEITAGLVNQVGEAEARGPGPSCPQCGQEMHYKGHKAKHISTETGEVTVERAYYYCEACRSGLFPPG